MQVCRILDHEIFTTMKNLNLKYCLKGVVVFSFLLLSMQLQAQHWYKIYNMGVNNDRAFNFTQTVDGGFVVSGTGLNKTYILKTDPNGLEQWRYFDYQDMGGDHVYTPDFGTVIGMGDYPGLVVYTKVNSSGDSLWSVGYTVPGAPTLNINHMLQLPDSGVICTGTVQNADNDVFITRADKNGNTLWTKQYVWPGDHWGATICPASNGEFFVFYGNPSGIPASLLRINASGDSVTTRPLAEIYGYGSAYNFIQTADGGYIVVLPSSVNAYQINVQKLDANGDQEWLQPLTFAEGHQMSGICQMPDGGYVLTGSIGSFPNVRMSLLKINSTGTIQWEREFSLGAYTAASNVKYLANGDLGICGVTSVNSNATPANSFIMKTTGNGLLFTNVVKGNIYGDFNDNCIKESGEVSLEGWTVVLSNGVVSIAATTDSLGNYEILADAGSYTLEIYNSSIYWEASSCSSDSTQLTLTANINGTYDTTTVDFPRVPLVNCPLLEVDISTPLLRRCFNNTYYVNYCNQGTQNATNAIVDVVLDPFFSLQSSTLPFTITSDTIHFSVGNIPVGDCGSFSFEVYVSCSAVLGQNHCVSAHIYPDSMCLTPNPNWDQSSIHVYGNCLGNDSTQFIIRNLGAGDMLSPKNYFIVEDNIMLFTNPFQLPSGDSLVHTFAANGSTMRMEAEQSTYHPWNDSPVAVTVEGCGTNGQGSFTIGLFNCLPEYDYEPYYSLDCQQNIGAYDPNDKRATPLGYDTEHFITADNRLEYHIRFQNTGTDTAFNIVVRDTISPFLDPATIIAGASSHAYRYRVYDGNVLEFTFPNILLPDSNINESGSHGFVKFAISQKPGNADGTVIYNSAGIYFDYNEPVITNQAWNTIGQNFIDIMFVNEEGGANMQLSAYPNPFSEMVTISVQGADGQKLQLEVLDMAGRVVKTEQFQANNQLVLHRDDLKAGIYLFRVTSGNQQLGNGKLVIR